MLDANDESACVPAKKRGRPLKRKVGRPKNSDTDASRKHIERTDETPENSRQETPVRNEEILPLSELAVNELINNDYISTDHVGKFNEILSSETDFRPQEALLMWNLIEQVCPVPINHRHIQILPSSATERVTHWICTYYDGRVIYVYDSLNVDKKFNLTIEQQQFLFRLFPQKPPIVYAHCQQQTNSTDCGVFAIAFAVSIAMDVNPSEKNFRVSTMREHLKMIFDNRHLLPFPDADDESDAVPAKKRSRPIKIVVGKQKTHGTDGSREKIEVTDETERNCLLKWKCKENSGFNYDPSILYETDSEIGIGSMSVICSHCKALRWKEESAGICCSNGKVKLEPLKDPPQPLCGLLTGVERTSKLFLSSIRNYNNAFQMTSLRAGKIFSEEYFLPTFKIQGQVYHLVGSLIPESDNDPKFLQIYFLGGEAQETITRCRNYPQLCPDIVKNLQNMLHLINKYIKNFKTVIDRQRSSANSDFKVIISADKVPHGENKGRFNAPAEDEVAVLIVGQEFERRDIILSSKGNQLQRISEIHRAYDPLQYPLMFPHGEDGYHINIRMHNSLKTVSAMAFYAYRIMAREGKVNFLHYFRQLFNQYLVDMYRYAKIESERLNYIRNNQKKLRVDNYIHLKDAINNDADLNNLGRLVILPSTFTGSPRYMHEKTQDAMTYVRKFGRPDLFITFTTNPKWKEISESLLEGQRPHDRHDIVSRVFNLKVKKLIGLLTKGKIFGPAICYMYTIEWQKRGLPRAHILLWLEKKISAYQIDSVICAELPVKDRDPSLFSIVKSNMIHGPCGFFNPKSPCMKDNRCTKRYPRPFAGETKTGEDGYPVYRRRAPEEGGCLAEVRIGRRDIVVDNRWIVPYCPVLSRTFNAHINVEYCNSVKSIKYVCKYVNKGSDQATFRVVNKDNDEIYQYQTGRYISTSEAAWRIFGFAIHERYPSVVHLAVHLENGQRVYFTESNISERLKQTPNTTLTAFFDLCSRDDFAKTLLYNEVPIYYVWNEKKFQRRKQGLLVDGFPGVRKGSAIGRVFSVHPSNSECYYLRLLLHHVRGPTSFCELKCVNGKQYTSFQAACQAYGMLEDDSHWDKTLLEASMTDSPRMIRDLFVVMLGFCNLSDATYLWNKYKNYMTEDIYHRKQLNCPHITVKYDYEMYNEALIIIEDKLFELCGKKLKDCYLPVPDRSMNRGEIDDYVRELHYDVDRLKRFVCENEKCLNRDQRNVYERVLLSINHSSGEMFFIDAPGGTGKTFLINLVLAKVRSEHKIAIGIASSGIAATLIPGGRTAHSALKLPLNLNYDTPVCNIKKGTPAAELLKNCSIIIWDECTMSHKGGIEALNRTLMDIRNSQRLMGGLTILFSGDFRQTLPVVPRGTRADEITASLKTSNIWKMVEKLTLTVNMRAKLKDDSKAGPFSEALIKLGNGEMKTDPNDEIEIHDTLGNLVSSVEDLVDKVYSNIVDLEEKNDEWLCERAIMSAKNVNADEINNYLIEKLAGDKEIFNSFDSVLAEEDAVHYPIEFLNSLNPSGMAPHTLIIKIGVPIMLLRNLDPPRLCNGTRLRVTSLQKNIIEGSVITSCAKGARELIPRIPQIPNDYPFEFKRVQFPVKVCFAITINKAQGQTLSIAGIDLRTPCFSHGQLYVACSRVCREKDLYILAPGGKTKNVVYKEALV